MGYSGRARRGSRLNRRGLLGVAGLSVAAGLGLVGCQCSRDDAAVARADAAAPSGESARHVAVADAGEPVADPGAAVHEGSALARSPRGDRLYVVDEDHRALHVLELPLGEGPARTVALPGRPAQVVALSDRVLVTLREPSALWIAAPGGAGELRETARVALPDDAWGLAVSRDGGAALVTSAWSSRLSRVDLRAAKLSWSVEVAREPRGVVLRDDGRAYVSHLTGSQLTRVDDTAGQPKVSRVELPAAPLRTPVGRRLPATLNYALALSPGGERLFAPRHAVGALGKNAWFGAASVDVLLTEDDTPLAPARVAPAPGLRSELAEQLISGGDTAVPGSSLTPFTQPRAVLYRSTTETLLVASEGDDRIVELDALALDPTMAVRTVYQVGSEYHPEIEVAKRGAAPAGLALSKDEATLWVYCRATNDVVQLALAAPDEFRMHRDETQAHVSLAPDSLGPGGATGRKLFYSALDPVASGGLACAGCHPEGRDDGMVWHQATFTTEDGEATNFTGSEHQIPTDAKTQGVPRRTPMLAGRVRAEGPYGWLGESRSLVERELHGFRLHRWGASPEHSEGAARTRAEAIADYLRRGLEAPVRATRPLSALEEQGRVLFESAGTGCSECHPAASEYTTRETLPLPPLPARAGFDAEPTARFKVPSLRYLAGRAPYFHDGSAPSLEALIANNHDRMGKTEHLTADERKALVAFLGTL